MAAALRSMARSSLLLGVVVCCILVSLRIEDRLSQRKALINRGGMSPYRATLCADAPAPAILEPRAPIPVANSTTPVMLLHILKTGGTTLSDMYARMFDRSQTIPGSNRSESIPPSIRPELRARKQADPQWRIGYAHEPYHFVNWLQFPVQPITIVRDPTTHLRSVWKSPVFNHCKTGVNSFREWLASDVFKPCAYIQATTLSSTGSHYPTSVTTLPAPDVALKEAKEHLEAMPWFGITDRWLESMCLMYYTFGWRPLASHEWEAQRVRHDTETFDDETMELLHRNARIDYELFEFANDLFDKRLRQMQYEVQNGAAPLDRPSTDVWLVDCIDLARGRLDPSKL